MSLPELPVGKRLKGAERNKVVTAACLEYGKGKTVRQIAFELGRSYGFAHRILTEGGTNFRSRGGIMAPVS